MKLAVITDTHFGVRGDSTNFLNYQKRFYDEIFFPKLKELGIDTVLHLGDLLDRRKYVNFATLDGARSMMLDPLRDLGIKVHIVVGNHDTYYKNTNQINGLKLLLGEYTNITTHDHEPTTLEFGGCEIMLSPWISPSNLEVSTKAFSSTKASILMGHFEFQGFEMMKGQLCDHGLDKNDFKKFSAIYSGHFHHPSSHDNIEYLGAPYEMTWTDYGGKRGFHIFDTDSREMEFVQNPYSMFNKLEYNDVDLTIEDIEALDASLLTNSYVKVIVKTKNNPYLFDLFIDKLQAAGCADIKVVEDSLNFDRFVEFEVLDEAQDTLSLLKTYVDGLEVKVSKDKVNVFLRELYQEAMSL